MGRGREGTVTGETYAPAGREGVFPRTQVREIDPTPAAPVPRQGVVIAPHNPSPVETQLSVAEAAARAIQYYAERFGPFPYSRLALTQMPGRDSQGWPGPGFLSSYAFLNEQERTQLHFPSFPPALKHQLPAHQGAHQGGWDLITSSICGPHVSSVSLSNYHTIA